MSARCAISASRFFLFCVGGGRASRNGFTGRRRLISSKSVRLDAPPPPPPPRCLSKKGVRHGAGRWMGEGARDGDGSSSWAALFRKNPTPFFVSARAGAQRRARLRFIGRPAAACGVAAAAAAAAADQGGDQDGCADCNHLPRTDLAARRGVRAKTSPKPTRCNVSALRPPPAAAPPPLRLAARRRSKSDEMPQVAL